MVFSKLAQLVEMSLDVPASEKKLARKIVHNLQQISNKIKAFNKHLDIIYNPFKNNNNVSKDSVVNNRASLIRYKEKIEENFKEMQKLALESIQNLNVFADTHVSELINALDDTLNDVEEAIKYLLTALDDIKSEQYRENVLTAIESVLKQLAQLDKLIFDRIIEHINTNIIASNWVDNMTETLHTSINEREPYVKRLFREREEKLRNILENR